MAARDAAAAADTGGADGDIESSSAASDDQAHLADATWWFEH